MLDEPVVYASDAVETAIYRTIQAHTGIDFSVYVRSRLDRRIATHADQRGVSLEEYADFLQGALSKRDALAQSFMIGQTCFFRAPAAFDLLLETIAPVVEARRSAGQPFRVWIAGSSTGEEAYSLALLMLRWADTICIHATDINRRSLVVASNGLYRALELDDMAVGHRRMGFADQRNGNVLVRSALREMVTFSPHDLLSDLPIAADVVICRNVLMHLNDLAQQHALRSIRHGLALGGWLLLGATESPGQQASYFRSLHSRWRLFQLTGKG